MNAIILAGGLGTRLRPLFPNTPKCLAPVGGKTFMEIQIGNLIAKRFTNIFVSLGYKSEEVIHKLKQIKSEASIFWCVETSPLGTLGAVNHVFSNFMLHQAFVFNGDTFVDFASEEMQTTSKVGNVLVYGTRVLNQERYGSIQHEKGLVTGFKEKGISGYGCVNA